MLGTRNGVHCNMQPYKSKRTRCGDYHGYIIKLLQSLFELYVTGLHITGTTQTNGGEALQEVQAQQWHNLSWLWCPVIPYNTPPLPSGVTTITDVAQSHGVNELKGYFMGILQEWSTDEGNDIWVFYQRVGKGWWLMSLYWTVWDLSMM